jgi:hypothetical protein
MTENNASMLHYIVAGDRLWNGVTVTAPIAAAYNRLTDKIAAYDRAGRKAPENILNGRHSLLNGHYNGNIK